MKIFGEGRIKESITRKRQAPSIATVGSTCDLNLKIPGELCPQSLLLRLHCVFLIPPPSPPSFLPAAAGNWFQMVSAQERLTRTFTRSSHTYTRTERTEFSKTRAGETKREVRVEESTQVGGDPFRDVFGDFLGRENLSGFSGMPAAVLQEGLFVCLCLQHFLLFPLIGLVCSVLNLIVFIGLFCFVLTDLFSSYTKREQAWSPEELPTDKTRIDRETPSPSMLSCPSCPSSSSSSSCVLR